MLSTVQLLRRHRIESKAFYINRDVILLTLATNKDITKGFQEMNTSHDGKFYCAKLSHIILFNIDEEYEEYA